MYGLKVGLVVASLFSIWVVGVRLVMGNGAFARLGFGWLAIVAVYYLGFALGGMLHGALLPLRRFFWGSVALYALFVLPVYCGILLALNIGRDSEIGLRGSLLGGLALASAVGVGVTVLERLDAQRSKQPPM